MNLDERLDRIASRALELEALLASGLSGDAFTQASREYAEIEPVVSCINGLRATEKGIAQAEALWPTRKCRNWRGKNWQNCVSSCKVAARSAAGTAP